MGMCQARSLVVAARREVIGALREMGSVGSLIIEHEAVVDRRGDIRAGMAWVQAQCGMGAAE